MSIALDVNTLMFAVVVTAPLFALAQFFLWTHIRTPALLWWACGSLLGAVGTLSLIARGQDPSLPTLVLGNTAIIAAMIVFWVGIRACQARPVPSRAIGAGLALVALVIVGIDLLDGDMRARMIAMSLFLSAASGMCAVDLLFRCGTMAVASSRFAGSVFGANAAFFLARALVISLLYSADERALDPVRIATYLETLVASIGWSYSFLMMTSQQAEERLQKLASEDELTGTYNRRAFLDVARRELARAHRGGPPFSFMIMDIDHFKTVNDSHGHPAGDLLLREFVRVSRECLRGADWLGRIGGEEFCVLLPDTRTHGATAVAERLRQTFAAATVEHGGRRIHATVSIGLAEFSTDIEDIGDLIARADAALYRAKDEGRNRVVAAGPIRAGSWRMPGLRLAWDGAYSSGNALIDADHEFLINRVNALLGRIQATEDVSSLAPEFRQILQWLVGHFHREEQILRPLDWPGLEEHAQQHASLAARGRELLASIERGEESLADLLDFLVRDVVGVHLVKHDTSFFPFLAGERQTAAG